MDETSPRGGASGNGDGDLSDTTAPDGISEPLSAALPLGATGTNAAAAAAEGRSARAKPLTVEQLVSKHHRNALRQLAEMMRESGALKIKNHTVGVKTHPDSFKGEYAAEWLRQNVPYVGDESNAERIAQAMLDIGAFQHVGHDPTFQPTSALYTFAVPSGTRVHENLRRLRDWLVAAEDQLVMQTKASKEAQEDAAARSVQLDWRVSIAEARGAAADTALRTCLTAQLTAVAAGAAAAAAAALPMPGPLAHALCALAAAAFIRVVCDLRFALQLLTQPIVDYGRIAKGIAGVSPESDIAAAQNGASGANGAAECGLPCDVPRLSTALGKLSKGCTKAVSFLGSAASAMRGTAAALKPPASLAAAAPSAGAPARLTLSRVSAPPSVPSPGPALCQAPRGSPAQLPRVTAPVHLGGEGGASRRGSSGWGGGTSAGGSLMRASESGVVPAPLLPTRNSRLNLTALPNTGVTAAEGPPAAADFAEGAEHPDFLVRQPAGPIALLSEGGRGGRVSVNRGVAHAFDGPLFAGRISVWVDGVPVAPGNESVFEGRRRLTWVIVQGRFKERVGAASVYTGQALDEPIRAPFLWALVPMVRLVISSFAAVVSSATDVSLTGGGPRVTYPLILGANIVHAAPPGREPGLGPDDAREDIRAALPQLPHRAGDDAANVAARRQFFSKASAREAFAFDTELVWTFHIWQHVVDVSSYRVPMLNLGLSRILNGQPLRFMAFDRALGGHIWNLEAWHKSLLAAHESPTKPKASGSSATSLAQSSPSSHSRSAAAVSLAPRQGAAESSVAAVATAPPLVRPAGLPEPMRPAATAGDSRPSSTATTAGALAAPMASLDTMPDDRHFVPPLAASVSQWPPPRRPPREPSLRVRMPKLRDAPDCASTPRLAAGLPGPCSHSTPTSSPDRTSGAQPAAAAHRVPGQHQWPGCAPTDMLFASAHAAGGGSGADRSLSSPSAHSHSTAPADSGTARLRYPHGLDGRDSEGGYSGVEARPETPDGAPLDRLDVFHSAIQHGRVLSLESVTSPYVSSGELPESTRQQQQPPRHERDLTLGAMCDSSGTGMPVTGGSARSNETPEEGDVHPVHSLPGGSAPVGAATEPPPGGADQKRRRRLPKLKMFRKGGHSPGH